ncbi:hypothetical protein O181_066806 [Austropuccinia psidii MF-1]|uniref:Uncharacterized protein n=1 Tax=Austropuccinia psidii MF-1 TaxID=1389203 RepID=A0A9Q3EYD7_9BASI|nr:hypothetical protein [Austropuccinia psidii MF-1]
MKESCHSEDSPRLRDKCQSQIPRTPSISHWLFSFKVFLQGNTGNTFSRDMQEAFQNNLPRVSAPSIHPGSHIHSKNVTGALLSGEGLALSKLGLIAEGSKDKKGKKT